MSKSNGYQPTTIETLPSNGSGATPPRKQSKFKAHFKKFWWLHLTSFVLCTILISLLLVYVGLPKIAQHDIDKAELLVDSQDVTEPTPKSVWLKMVTTVVNHSPFRPTLDAFPVDLYLEKTKANPKPFGRLTIPRMHAQKRNQITVEQNMDIIDMEQFIEYNKLVTQSVDYKVALSGKTKLHLGALPVVSVNFNKVLTIKGLNSLKGLQVQDIKLSLTAGPDGSNMNGTLFIPNPSPMTLTLGDVVQEIFVKIPGKPDLFIGNTTIPNLVLKPGPNYAPMKSIADQGKVLPLLSSTFKDSILPIQARTVSITYKGQRLEYFEAAMKTTPVDTTLDLTGALKSLAAQLGVDVALLTGGTPAPKSGGGSSSSSAALGGASPATSAAGAAAPTAAAPPPATTPA